MQSTKGTFQLIQVLMVIFPFKAMSYLLYLCLFTKNTCTDLTHHISAWRCSMKGCNMLVSQKTLTSPLALVKNKIRNINGNAPEKTRHFIFKLYIFNSFKQNEVLS